MRNTRYRYVDRTDRFFNFMEKWFPYIWVAWALFCLAVVVTVIVVVIHFISKVW